MEKIIEKLISIKNELSGNITLATFKSLLERVDAIIVRYYGTENIYKTKIAAIYIFIDITSFLDSNKTSLMAMLDLVIDDIELSKKKDELILRPELETKKLQWINEEVKSLNNKVFIVHGHNDTMKLSVARFIDKLNLESIILHEQPNEGLTIIEKFYSNANVGFAIILLSADDIGYSKKEGNSNAKDRARQNVIFELGFFTAKLGRKKVVALVENSTNFEIPSDYYGVIYIPYDGVDGKWKFSIAKELMDSGYDINLKNII